MDKSYKQALIDVILSCKNNPYTIVELESLRVYIVQQIHDNLMLSRGEPIQKLNTQEMMFYHEIQWT